MFSDEMLFGVPDSLASEKANEDFFADWQSELAKPLPSLLMVLYRGVRRDVVLSGCLLLASTSAQLLQPLLLQQVIEFFHKYRNGNSVTLGDGLFLALFMGMVD
ncbi:hypothetical protein GGI22_002293, partial [Coemansia erecta]